MDYNHHNYHLHQFYCQSKLELRNVATSPGLGLGLIEIIIITIPTIIFSTTSIVTTAIINTTNTTTTITTASITTTRSSIVNLSLGLRTVVLIFGLLSNHLHNHELYHQYKHHCHNQHYDHQHHHHHHHQQWITRAQNSGNLRLGITIKPSPPSSSPPYSSPPPWSQPASSPREQLYWQSIRRAQNSGHQCLRLIGIASSLCLNTFTCRQKYEIQNT